MKLRGKTSGSFGSVSGVPSPFVSGRPPPSAWIQTALTEEPPEFETAEEGRDYIKRIQKIFHSMTSGYSVPGSVMSGLYENTAYFRIGDTSRPENTVTKVVIRGGGLDYEDPGTKVARYPADYTFRLIDLVVRK